MSSPPGRRAAAPSGPPAFRNRTEAGVLLGAALREVLGQESSDPERVPVGTGPPALAGDRPGGRPVVFAIPRGGVAVAAGVARALGVPLDVLMVRKIGHPTAPELGLGAIAEDGAGGTAEPYFDAEMLARVGLTRDDLTEVVARERAELARRVAVYGSISRRAATAAVPPAGVPPSDVPPASAEAEALVGPPAVQGGDAPSFDSLSGAGTADATGAAAGRAVDVAGRLVVVVDDGLATGVTARAALRALRARGAARLVLAVPVAAAPAVSAIQRETGEVVTLVTSRRFRSVGEWYADFGQLTDADVLTLLAAVP
jgi:putative phosphoribosyl transferase